MIITVVVLVVVVVVVVVVVIVVIVTVTIRVGAVVRRAAGGAPGRDHLAGAVAGLMIISY